MRRFQISKAEMRRAQGDDGHDDRHHRQGQGDGKAAGMFWPEIVEIADEQNGADGGQLQVFPGHAKIAHGIPATHGGCHDEVGQQQQRAEHGQHPALLARGRINAAAIREMPANDDVVVADQPGQNANRQDDWKRGKTGGDKGQPNDVGLACAPVTVEQSRRSGPADVARTMCADFHCSKFISRPDKTLSNAAGKMESIH